MTAIRLMRRPSVVVSAVLMAWVVSGVMAVARAETASSPSTAGASTPPPAGASTGDRPPAPPPPPPGATSGEASAQSSSPAPIPPTAAELDAISRRGRLLFAYDQAAWHGTDAVQALHPDDSRVRMFLARQDAPGKWRVVFGKPSDADDAFLIAYEAVQIGGPVEFAASAKDPPIADKDWFLRASRALAKAMSAIEKPGRPYNVAVLPASMAGEWYVYAYPAMTEEGRWPIGGDWRYTVSADGRTIDTVRQLHKTIVEGQSAKDLEAKGVAKPEFGWHTHVLACIPEDTDVLAVLSRTPRVPEIIACQPFVFHITVGGDVRYEGLFDEWVKGEPEADQKAPGPAVAPSKPSPEAAPQARP